MSTDLTGQKFHMLLVKNYSHRKGRQYWQCVCDCGVEKSVRKDHLTEGRVKSCGCSREKFLAAANTTHGMYGTPEYKSYHGMIERCFNKNNPRYPEWGGRGISVVEEWKSSFENFFADMGFKPDKTYSIERLDNDANYSKANCVWATSTEQNRNRSNTIFLEYKGIVKPLAEVAEILNIDYFALRLRYVRGDRGDKLFRPLKGSI